MTIAEVSAVCACASISVNVFGFHNPPVILRVEVLIRINSRVVGAVIRCRVTWVVEPSSLYLS